MDTLEKLIDEYADEAGVAVCSYGMLDRMLDTNYIKDRIHMLNVSEMYIYGAGCLGIHFYHTVRDMINVVAVVDRNKMSLLRLPALPVMWIEEFRDSYRGQKVIIASVRFYKEIRESLSDFVPQEQILFLGEFLGGIV